MGLSPTRFLPQWMNLKQPRSQHAHAEQSPMEHESHERHVVVETRADDETHAADTSSQKGDNRKKKTRGAKRRLCVCLAQKGRRFATLASRDGPACLCGEDIQWEDC